MPDELIFAEESPTLKGRKKDPWKILIVDDESSVHMTTKLVLNNFHFMDRELAFFSAYSAQEAKALLKAHDDFALIFLDVVMEEQDSGLKLVRYIREELENQFVRIVLRTGQPGYAPEEDVVVAYDINDYKTKTELSVTKMTTTLISALRGYHDLVRINRNRANLERVIDASTHLYGYKDLSQFATVLVEEARRLFDDFDHALYIQVSTLEVEGDLIVAASHLFRAAIGQPLSVIGDDRLLELIQRARASGGSQQSRRYFVGYHPLASGREELLIIAYDFDVEAIDQHLMELFSSNVAIAFDNVLIFENITAAQEEVFTKLSEIVEKRDFFDEGHSRTVGEIAWLLARELGLSEEEARVLRLVAPLHDLGKVALPEALLNKPTEITEEEYAALTTHAKTGYDLLKSKSIPLLQIAASVARYHHENFDGSGYPEGIAGERIPIYARIMKVVDVYDAMGRKKAYRGAHAEEAILSYIKERSGSEFDPRVVEALMAKVDEIRRLKR